MELNNKKLTQLSTRCGCAGKFTPEGLAKVFKSYRSQSRR